MNFQTLFLYSEKQNSCKTTKGQKFRRGQKFRLTPALWSVISVLFVIHVIGPWDCVSNTSNGQVFWKD